MPNGEDKKLNFVAKVLDPVTNTYRPIYIAPDATNDIQGDVFLTDSIAGSEDAATGMKAVTPKAVKTETDRLDGEVDRIDGEIAKLQSGLEVANPYRDQTVGSTKDPIWLNNGTFEQITGIDADKITSGTIDIARLPQGALERLVPVADEAARFALTKKQVQLGDIVQQQDTKVMYVVVDESKLNEAAGYTEFSAGLATKALKADVSDKLGVGTIGSATQPIYLDNGTPKPVNVAGSTGKTVNIVPVVNRDGVMEVGKYLDFHNVDSTKDYDARLQVNNANARTLTLPDESGTLAIVRRCLVGQSSSTTTNPWYKVATYETSSANIDTLISFHVYQTMSDNVNGILNIRLRTNNPAKFQSPSITWSNAVNIDPSDFVLAYSPGETTPCKAELWAKMSSAWNAWVFTVIQESSRTAIGSVASKWKLISKFSAGDQAEITSGYTQKISTLSKIKNTAVEADHAAKATSADAATKLATPRAITLTGPCTGTGNFDGSAPVSIPTTIAQITTADIDKMFAGTYSADPANPKFVESEELKYFVNIMKEKIAEAVS